MARLPFRICRPDRRLAPLALAILIWLTAGSAPSAQTLTSASVTGTVHDASGARRTRRDRRDRQPPRRTRPADGDRRARPISSPLSSRWSTTSCRCSWPASPRAHRVHLEGWRSDRPANRAAGGHRDGGRTGRGGRSTRRSAANRRSRRRSPRRKSTRCRSTGATISTSPCSRRTCRGRTCARPIGLPKHPPSRAPPCRSRVSAISPTASSSTALSANDDAADLAGTFFSEEVIREFQVVTSGGVAEFGRASSGIVSVVTKSGTNQPVGPGLRVLPRRHL